MTKNEEKIINNPDIEAEISKEEENKFKQEQSKKLAKERKKLKDLEEMSKLSNIDVEKAVIYIGIQHFSHNFVEYTIDNKLKAEQFISPAGNYIFNTAMEVFENLGKVDFLLLKEELDKKGKEMAKKKISLGNFLKFGGFIPKKDLIKDYSLLLQKNKKSNDLHNLTLNLAKAIKEKDVEQTIYLQQEIAEFDGEVELEENANPDLGLMTNNYLSEQFTEYMSGGYKTSKSKLRTGLKQLDEYIGGIERGNFVIFAARPSVGKSVNMMSVMSYMTKNNYRCLYVSAEMYGRYLYSRWLSMLTNISQDKIRNPSKLNQKEKRKLETFNEEFKTNDLCHFYYDTVVTARSIEQTVREIESNHGPIDAIFVDYLGKLFPNDLNMNRSRNDVVGTISTELFNLGGKLGVGMITASQLSRDSSKNAEIQSMVAPKMTDLRDSGNVEQDADIIIGITRNVKEAEACLTEEDSQDLIWHVIKNRNGNIGEVNLTYYPKTFIVKDKSSEFFIDDKSEKNSKDINKKISKKEQEQILDEILEESDNGLSAITDSIF